jgi:flagellar hook assembly protein FlgD
VKLSFEHNLFNDAIEVEMDVISLQGELIGTLSPETYYSNGYLAGTVTWDGRNRNGAEVNDGIYLLRIRATNGKTSAEKSIRVVKVRK